MRLEVAIEPARELVRPTEVLAGFGLHLGCWCTVQPTPAAAGTGVRFLRVDLVPPVVVPVGLDSAVAAVRRTELRRGPVTVSTVEHLLAALFALGVFDAEILLDGPEVPALDGSAAPFARALLAASRPTTRPGSIWRVVKPVTCCRGASVCRLSPGGGLTIDCQIDFAHPAVGRQRVRLDAARQEQFLRRFAPARTFGFLEEAAALSGQGLARGASLRRALVFGPSGPLNPGGSRFRDEPVRHKVVDALGDLALLGAGLAGAVRLERSSHRLVHQALRRGIAEGALVREPGPGPVRASITDPDPAVGHNRG